MTDDEQAIRELVLTWMKASEAGDVNTVVSLMTDDMIFMVPGREPFGKEEFRAASEGMKNVRLAGTSDIREIKVLGDWAYIRNYIEITVTPPRRHLDAAKGIHALDPSQAIRWKMGALPGREFSGLTSFRRNKNAHRCAIVVLGAH
jgi:uncharacterized protein (TIGR02246 family)